MPRSVYLSRRITAGVGGWAGDGANWSQSSPPAAVGGGQELTSPIFAILPRRRDYSRELSHGVAGLVRVTGADSTRKFSLKVFVEWVRKETGQSDVSDWRLLTGTSAAEVGDGSDFTTDPADLKQSRVAFHLTPIGGNLSADSVVEIWAAEV